MDDVMKLYVLYDHGCGLCSHLVQWMSRQHSTWELQFVAAGSPESRQLFPDLTLPSRPEELIVVGEDGAVYRGDAAYIMCLYALDGYRPLAIRMSQPTWRPLARRIFTMISTNRLQISDFLGLRSEEALTQTMVSKEPDVLDGRHEPTW